MKFTFIRMMEKLADNLGIIKMPACLLGQCFNGRLIGDDYATWIEALVGKTNRCARSSLFQASLHSVWIIFLSIQYYAATHTHTHVNSQIFINWCADRYLIENYVRVIFKCLQLWQFLLQKYQSHFVEINKFLYKLKTWFVTGIY